MWVVPRPVAPGPCILAPWLEALPPGPRDLLALLPVADINGFALSAIGGLKRRPDPGLFAAIFCADPFLRVRDVVEALQRAGIRGVTNFPTVQAIAGQTARDLDSADLGVQREIRVLGDFARAGLQIAAFASSAEAGALMGRLGAGCVILHPGPAATDWRGRAAAARRTAEAIRSLRHLTDVPVRLFYPDGFNSALDPAARLVDGVVRYGN